MNARKKTDGPIEVMDLKQGKLTWAGNKYVAGGLLVVAVALFVAGTQISWTVWDHTRHKYVKAGSNINIGSEQHISDFKLTEDATFSGVESIDGQLYTIYDRSKAIGKQACPT